MSVSLIRCLQISRNSTVWRGIVRIYATDKDSPPRQHIHQPQARHERVFGRRNLLERRSYEELMLGVKGKKQKRGSRAKASKKGGSKMVEEDVMELGYGHDEIHWTGISRYLPHLPRNPLDWDGKVKAKVDGYRMSKDEEKLGRFLKNSLTHDKDSSWSSWSKRGTGWTGRSWGGRHVSFPVLPDGRELRDFDSIVIEVTRVSHQTTAGRQRSIRALVVVGNNNGVVGFAIGKADETSDAINRAKNKAATKLYFIDRCDGHTIYHSVKEKFCKTIVTMERRTPGHGLRCQRAIAAICELAGIKDIRAKITGPTTLINLVPATFKALLAQKPHQTLADQSGLHVVEMRKEMFNRPVVVASPTDSTTASSEVARQLGMTMNTPYLPYNTHKRTL
ncbi:small ribosomal subunit protein uS5m-like [Dysidea avara]|uniref:small ribosomal subunit protein uS5m-like n=1 Tax=Dysidea avara TaxID=196820 RepID=UPI00332FA627